MANKQQQWGSDSDEDASDIEEKRRLEANRIPDNFDFETHQKQIAQQQQQIVPPAHPPHGYKRPPVVAQPIVVQPEEESQAMDDDEEDDVYAKSKQQQVPVATTKTTKNVSFKQSDSESEPEDKKNKKRKSVDNKRKHIDESDDGGGSEEDNTPVAPAEKKKGLPTPDSNYKVWFFKIEGLPPVTTAIQTGTAPGPIEMIKVTGGDNNSNEEYDVPADYFYFYDSTGKKKVPWPRYLPIAINIHDPNDIKPVYQYWVSLCSRNRRPFSKDSKCSKVMTDKSHFTVVTFEKRTRSVCSLANLASLLLKLKVKPDFNKTVCDFLINQVEFLQKSKNGLPLFELDAVADHLSLAQLKMLTGPKAEGSSKRGGNGGGKKASVEEDSKNKKKSSSSSSSKSSSNSKKKIIAVDLDDESDDESFDADESDDESDDANEIISSDEEDSNNSRSHHSKKKKHDKHRSSSSSSSHRRHHNHENEPQKKHKSEHNNIVTIPVVQNNVRPIAPLATTTPVVVVPNQKIFDNHKALVFQQLEILKTGWNSISNENKDRLLRHISFCVDDIQQVFKDVNEKIMRPINGKKH